MTDVHLVDYGVGNIHNVRRALHHAGANVIMAREAQALDGARALVIPGVGAFADCVGRFHDSGMVEPALELMAGGCPVLGICVGMQMLADHGEEFGGHPGLSVIPGRVRMLPVEDRDGDAIKLPHIGWRGLHAGPSSGWEGTPLAGTGDGDEVYFVHSYGFECADEGSVLARCHYRGVPVTAAVRTGSVFGVQFHPEKSGEVGLTILRRFLALAGA